MRYIFEQATYLPTFFPQELYKSGKLPSLSDLEKGRKNPESYNVFAQFLVTGCIKSSTWKDSCKIHFFSSIVNESDEAVTFLILANNWDAWKEQCDKGKDGKPPKVRTLTAKQMYMQQDGRGYSFNVEGREYYNKMFDCVEKDREENGIHFDQQLLNILNGCNDTGGKENTTKRKAEKESVKKVLCRHAGPNKMRKVFAESAITGTGQNVAFGGSNYVKATNVTTL